jgi:CheY-like chemotaxis protein
MQPGLPILLVEDNPGDVYHVSRAFKDAGLTHPLHVVAEGAEAIAYLSGTGHYADRRRYPMPHLVIAELNTPSINGFELIQWMRADRGSRLIPLIVLSCSMLPADVSRAYALGANAYMVKPAEPAAIERLFRTIAEFWEAGQAPQPQWVARPSTATLP